MIACLPDVNSEIVALRQKDFCVHPAHQGKRKGKGKGKGM